MKNTDEDFHIPPDMFERLVLRRMEPYAAAQLVPTGVETFVSGLRAASRDISFVSEMAATLWLETIVDHFLASQSHGECAQHSMMVLTQTSLQAMLSVRHTVMDNTLTNRYIGSIAPHLSKSVLCPIKHPTTCTMIVATTVDDYTTTYALAKSLEHRLVVEFSASSEPHNATVLLERDHMTLFRVARMTAAELFGNGGDLVSVAIEWLASDVRCALSHTWPSDFATTWNHANGANCFAIARDRPLSVALFLYRPLDTMAQVVEVFGQHKRKPQADECGGGAPTKSKKHGDHQAQQRPKPTPDEVAYVMHRVACSLGADRHVNDEVLWEIVLRRRWLPMFLNSRALGVPGIQGAWVARYSCPISKAKGDTRRFCVKTRGSNVRALVGGTFSISNGGVVDRDTAASDDLSSSSGMGLFGVDTAVSYLCHEEVARANGVFAEHVFVLGMLLSHSGTIANVSGKGYARLGADFCGQIAVEDIRSALHQAALGMPYREGQQLSKASAIMFGRQTAGDGTNVSRYEWSPDDDECRTQAEVAAADPANYGVGRPLLSALHRHWKTQNELHHSATKRRVDDEWMRDDDPRELFRRFDAMNICV